jgi:hypothetical protein
MEGKYSIELFRDGGEGAGDFGVDDVFDYMLHQRRPQSSSASRSSAGASGFLTH